MQGYEAMIRFFLEMFKEVPLLLILATSVVDPELNARICARNRVVSELAKKYNLPVIDFYTASHKCTEMIEDGIHFTKEGYRVLAKELLKRVCEEISGIVLPQEVFE